MEIQKDQQEQLRKWREKCTGIEEDMNELTEQYEDEQNTRQKLEKVF